MNQKNKLYYKLILDFVMLLCLVLLYNKRTISMSFHELGGLTLFLLFIIHNVLNYKWIINTAKRFFTQKTGTRIRLQWILNLVLLLDFTVIIVTGIMISKTLPFKFNGFMGVQKWHYFAAALSIILMGIHLGLHWQMIHSLSRRIRFLPQKALKGIGCILLIATLIWGSYSMVSGSYARWITAPFTTTSENTGHGGSEFHGEADTISSATSQSSDSNSTANQTPPSNEAKGEGFENHQKMEQSSFSILNVFKVLCTYGSEIMVFAFITSIIDFLLSKRKLKKIETSQLNALKLNKE